MHRFPFGLEQYRDLELSTQVLIRAAIERQLEIEILDRTSNTIRLTQTDTKHSEIVIQATKTSKDSYVCTELMGLKNVSKLLLGEAGLPVPQGRYYQNPKQALEDFIYWSHPKYSDSFIIKPNSTNYGIGITRLQYGCTQQEYQQAITEAFSHDSNILIERFIPGKEYRFLVIERKLCAVLQRIPANITGNGNSSITELIEQKNNDPWRIGKQGNHISPLETIELNATERKVLQEQGLTLDSIPPSGQQIFLRHNSNISTGGDSLDKTDKVHPGYTQLAEACAQILNAQICGVDIISTNIQAAPNQNTHAIIEINFNPVLYCHEYPALGKPRPVAAAVIELLFGQIAN